MINIRYRDNQKESLVKSAHLETIDKLQDMITPKRIGELLNTPVFEEPELRLSPMELAVYIMDNSIKDWQVYQVIYSRKIGAYLSGKSEPIIHRVGSSFISEGGKRPFGIITSKQGGITHSGARFGEVRAK